MPGGSGAPGPAMGNRAHRSSAVGIAMVAFSSLGGILFGQDTGAISGIIQMDDWLRKFGVPVPVSATNPIGYGLPTSRESLIVSILSVGTVVGALSGAPTGDILGRRLGIIASCVVFSLGVALQTGAHNLATFIVGRFFAGLGVGLVSTLVPMYQSECAPKWIRGAVVSCYQWAITIGILLASVFNNATKNRQNHSAWQIPIGIQFVWPFILFVGMFWLPESPRWLIKKGREADAAKALSRLTALPADDPDLHIELEDIRAAFNEERENGESSYLDCFRFTHNKIAFRTITGITVQALQQLTGINYIFYYGTTFFQNSGIQNPFLVSIATSTVNVVMTLPGMWAIERWGRRPLLLYGGAVMSLCEYLIAIIGVTVSVHNVAAQKALIALVSVYISAEAMTWGPIAWVITGEMYPLNVRAKAMSLSAASNWLWNWALAFATPYLVNSGPGNAGLGVKVFFIWGSTCACCVVFTYFCIPETKGLSLEQIDLLYQHSTPITSARYRRELIAGNVHIADVSKGGPEATQIDRHNEDEKAMVEQV